MLRAVPQQTFFEYDITRCETIILTLLILQPEKYMHSNVISFHFYMSGGGKVKNG